MDNPGSALVPIIILILTSHQVEQSCFSHHPADITCLILNGDAFTTLVGRDRQFVKRLRQDYHIIQFKKKKQSLQMLSFLDYNNDSNDDAKDYNGFITERANIRLIDLCRCAFPEMVEYRSEILKDDLINLFEDMPTEKQITRDNLPLDEMREPRTVLCNLYKKKNGIDNREMYANLVLQKRRTESGPAEGPL